MTNELGKNFDIPVLSINTVTLYFPSRNIRKTKQKPGIIKSKQLNCVNTMAHWRVMQMKTRKKMNCTI